MLKQPACNYEFYVLIVIIIICRSQVCRTGNENVVDTGEIASYIISTRIHVSKRDNFSLIVCTQL